MAEKGRKAARKWTQLGAHNLLPDENVLTNIRQIATIDPDEILEDSAKANNGKKDYAYAFGVLSEMINHIAWLATLEEQGSK